MASHTGNEQYDSALLSILQNEGKVAPFVDVVLGFLYRRTDFFRIMKSETDKLGFPPGVACKLLMNIFKKYEALAAKDSERLEEIKKARQASVQVPTEAQKPETQEKSTDTSNSDETNPATSRVDDKMSTEPTSVLAQSTESMETDEAPKTADNEVAAKTQSGPSGSKGDGDEEEEDPEQVRKRRELQSNPLTYNGAETETYYWSQTITETDVRVKVPESIVKGKQVKVDIQTKHLKVSKQEADGSWSELVNNELTWDVNKEESMWTLSPGEFVHVNLEKRMERWWENVFVNEPKINTLKIDCSRPMTDLDDEAQAKIEEMMYNQRQKQLGLPQSHEQKTTEMLRKAWDAEGSPFKGQPFDPSKFSTDANGVVNFNQ